MLAKRMDTPCFYAKLTVQHVIIKVFHKTWNTFDRLNVDQLSQTTTSLRVVSFFDPLFLSYFPSPFLACKNTNIGPSRV